ncbi:MAG: carboxypeptidase regulatory-like domain-containing protein [Planctomycetes bacterium]|nr:carboxypeptidase regulatory-like domain-containing protein [Planctomycetota bacterium]
MRRAPLLVLAAGLCAAAVYVATRPAAPPQAPPVPGPSSDVAQAEVAPRELAAAPDEASARATAAPTQAADLELAVDAWTVRVTQDGAPAGDALVTVSDLGTLYTELDEAGVGFDTPAGRRLRAERALTAHTDAEGLARFATLPHRAMVEARRGDAWAFAALDSARAEREIALALEADHALDVRVLDEAGAPVGGVPVALRLPQPGPRPFSFKWTDTAPESGVATFLHLQRRLAQGAPWQATFAFPVVDAPVVLVDERTPLASPLELRLPPTGSALVRVRTPEGGACDLDGLELRLLAFAPATGDAPLWPEGPWARPHVDDTGDVRVPWLGLGLEIEARLVRADERVVASARFAGPKSAGEEALGLVTLARRAAPAVTGRFVLADGSAWPACTASVQERVFPMLETWPQPRDLAVDALGRFRLEVHEPRPEHGSRALRFRAEHPTAGGTVFVEVPLDDALPPGETDLGDVLLDHGELVVAGRVVDATGAAILRAWPRVQTRTLAGAQEFWPNLDAAGTEFTGADGAFALYLPPGAPRPGGDLRLRVRANGWVERDEPAVRFGQTDVVVVLARAGALAGSLAPDGSLAAADLAIVLSGETMRYAWPRADGDFEAGELPPGTYALEVKLRNATGSASLARVEDLVVRAGETCRDPRVQGLRVEAPGTTVRVRVLARGGAPIPHAAVTLAGDRYGRSALSDANGVAVVRCPALPVDLEVGAMGYRRAQLLGVDGDREVVLDAGLPIVLHTAADPSGSEPAYELGVFLYAVSADGATREMAWGFEYTADPFADHVHFDAHGELALSVPAPGVYECDVHVTVLAEGVGRGGSVLLDPKPRITVLEHVGEQRFELDVPADATRAAVQRALE